MAAGRGAPALLLCLLRLLICQAQDQSIVLPPPTANSTLPVKMLVFVPGGAVPNEHYVATAKAIQESVTEISLWVVIPAVFKRLCIISCSATALCAPLHGVVEDVLSTAQTMGWKRGKDDEDLWLAGHSLGGVCANTLFQAYSQGAALPYAGIMVFGSYVDESGAHDLTNYPKPVLIANGELDAGMARPGKTAIWWRQYLALEAAQGEQYALTHKPVVVLPKLNHSDFCPGFDVFGDLMAEVSQAEATSVIGKTLGAFLDVQVAGATKPGALDFLRSQVSWTRDFLKPYLQLQDMERVPTDVRLSSEGASPLCVQAQHIIAGLADADDKRLTVSDGFHVASTDLEHCHTTWNMSADGLATTTCSHADFYPDIDNTGEISAASQVACKLLSSARVAQQMKVTAARPNVDCRAINQYAVQVAESVAPSNTLDRFKRVGRKWCFLDDVQTVAGPLWLLASLKLEANATCMTAASAALVTSLDSPIFPGNHYCKVLSPARVLDWMMSDSLKPALGAAAPEVLEGEQVWV